MSLITCLCEGKFAEGWDLFEGKSVAQLLCRFPMILGLAAISLLAEFAWVVFIGLRGFTIPSRTLTLFLDAAVIVDVVVVVVVDVVRRRSTQTQLLGKRRCHNPRLLL